MKRFLLSIGASLMAVFVTACVPAPHSTTTPSRALESPASAASSSSPARSATIEGVLQKAGVSIYMQGTHRLLMDDGTFLLLQSSAVRLDDFVDSRVIVTGNVQPAVETGGMIMNVEMLVPTESLPPEVLIESAQFGGSSSAFSSTYAAVPTGGATASFAAPISSQSQSSSIHLSSAAATPPPAPSVPAAPIAPLEAVSSSSASASSLASSSADASAIIKTMAKAAVGQETFTIKYCNGHIGFCVPLHKYWFYKSFGAAVSPFLWHVEISSQSVEEAGQGVLVVNLVSGALVGPEGAAVVQGDFAVASRQWTGNRHFEITGPAELKAAVEFMANGVEVYSVE